MIFFFYSRSSIFRRRRKRCGIVAKPCRRQYNSGDKKLRRNKIMNIDLAEKRRKSTVSAFPITRKRKGILKSEMRAKNTFGVLSKCVYSGKVRGMLYGRLRYDGFVLIMICTFLLVLLLFLRDDESVKMVVILKRMAQRYKGELDGL